MARCFSLKAKGISMTHAFDIDAPVGTNGANRREDVLLIQYLLAVWMATEKNLPKLTPLLALTPELKIDGIFGNKTKGVINTFEVFHQPVVNRDGRIDPLASVSRKLFILNQILFFAGGLRDRGIPELVIPFPAALVAPLYR